MESGDCCRVWRHTFARADGKRVTGPVTGRWWCAVPGCTSTLLSTGGPATGIWWCAAPGCAPISHYRTHATWTHADTGTRRAGGGDTCAPLLASERARAERAAAAAACRCARAAAASCNWQHCESSKVMMKKLTGPLGCGETHALLARALPRAHEGHVRVGVARDHLLHDGGKL